MVTDSNRTSPNEKPVKTSVLCVFAFASGGKLYHSLNMPYVKFWFMGYRPRANSPARSRGRQRTKQERKKARGKKRRSRGKYLLEERHTPTSEEVLENTLSRLRSLGNQVFALFPFRAYFNDWLVSLKDVLIALEANPNVSVDEQFVKERTEILARIERALEKGSLKEISLSEAIKKLSHNRTLLERIEKDYATGRREIERRKNSENKRLQKDIRTVGKELDELAKVKAGLFRVVSKKEKAQKKTEAVKRLKALQNKLELTAQNAADEKEKLQKEYEKRKQLVIRGIGNLQKEIANSEVDHSLKARQAACEALANAVKELLKRETS